MSERRSLGLVFVGCGVVAVAIIGGALWRLTGTGGAQSSDPVVVVVLALAGLCAALAFIWARVDLRLLSPMERLQRELDTLLHSTPDRPLDLPGPGALGPLVSRIDRLVTQADAARRDLAASVTAATTQLEDERERLAAVLRDLSEGVIVCNAQHRILLFNAAARRTPGVGDALGLGRPVGDIFLDTDLHATFDSMRAADEAPYAPVQIDLENRAGGQRLTARMAAVVDLDGTVEGYVLSFPGTPATKPEFSSIDLPPRPEFYDFDLFQETQRLDATVGKTQLSSLDFVVFDTETTGLNPDRGDAIVQIGAARVRSGGVLTNETFETLVNPGRPIPGSSIRFHGITDDMVTEAPVVSDAVGRLHRFAGEAVLVAQNAAFDMKFLRLSEAAASVRFDMPVLDTMLLSFHLHPGEADHTLDGLAARYGVDIVGRHTALGDAVVTAEVLCRMLPLLSASGVDTLDDALAVTRRMARRHKVG